MLKVSLEIELYKQCVKWFDLIWLFSINQIKSSQIIINQIIN
jgi:hypothetical protein